jgi:hypothetical protein
VEQAEYVLAIDMIQQSSLYTTKMKSNSNIYKGTAKPQSLTSISDLCTRCAGNIILVDDDVLVGADRYGSFYALSFVQGTASSVIYLVKR